LDVADPPLAEAVDVEAVDELFRTDNDSVRVSFAVWNLAVVVTPTEVRVFEYQS
jgi:hypothetical protein